MSKEKSLKVCPVMSTQGNMWFCVRGYPRYRTALPQEEPCQIWTDSGCGLVQQEGAPYQVMWAVLKQSILDTLAHGKSIPKEAQETRTRILTFMEFLETQHTKT